MRRSILTLPDSRVMTLWWGRDFTHSKAFVLHTLGSNVFRLHVRGA